MADTRRAAALCLLLPLLVFSLANPYLAEAGKYVCMSKFPMMPFCAEWMCTAECWTEAKLNLATVKEYRCAKGGIKGYCYCLFCGDNLKQDEVQEPKPQELIHN
ncbi:uncharacterized protein LOC112268895 [Brachypodium distachyon]|uniref:Knottin scorpion toxin-like domain-containing protein n=1 Tax=Brachypodium distachyon TaxID=15368 RepID=A0A2K2CLZ6_BRADI|nr:uncharacterized protein LOC112268895 [Brachypodium distachyon]PNT63050.1 hypothetical protein BRADI_4g10938v3 [Brachypodium distachyon]|eukprot:XP_024310927.1 uncharacterized protein LOC112268895 [Brachypodium distachyon]